jgi:AraC-like DNA-binding protein
MSAIFEGRESDSPYIEKIWRGRVEEDYMPVCPADVRWNLLFTRYQGQTKVSAEGPTTQSVTKHNFASAEFLVIKFRLGIYMPSLPVGDLLNGDQFLPLASSQTFWLQGSSWQFPDFENAETFVARMMREGLLSVEPVVSEVLKELPQEISSRTVRRRFLHSTGLTHKAIQQIERAQQAAALLGQGMSIADATYELGYSDQPHLTRSLKRFLGQTPSQVARDNLAASLSADMNLNMAGSFAE